MTPSSRRQVSARFAIEQLLGEGGSSVVWKAKDASTGQLVALKCLKRAADGSFLLSKARFVAEAAMLQGLAHPSIVRVVGLGEDDDGSPYFAMEYLGEQTLATKLRDGPLSLETALQLLLPIADALTYLHARGIVHRDLKPENIGLAEDADGRQRGVLLDLGVAKSDGPSLTQSGMTVGTPLYMAPEQALSGTITPQTDVWGLASVLYTCLSGAPPFSGSNTTQVLLRIVTERAAPLSARITGIPHAVARVVDRALSTDPKSRHASIESFVQALDDAWSRSRANRAPSTSPPPDFPKAAKGTAGEAARVVGGGAAIAPTQVAQAEAQAPPAIQVIPWQDIFAVVDNGRGHPSEYGVLHGLVTLQAGCFPDGIGCLAIIPPSATPPAEAAREALASALRAAKGSLRCMCWLVEGSGFQGAMTHAVLVGLRLVTRRAYPTHISTNLDEALGWMLENLPNGRDRRSDIAKARAEIMRRRET